MKCINIKKVDERERNKIDGLSAWQDRHKTNRDIKAVAEG